MPAYLVAIARIDAWTEDFQKYVDQAADLTAEHGAPIRYPWGAGNLIVKIWAVGALYAVGWFLIALYVVVTPIVVRKWHFWFLHDAILVLLIFGLINTGCGLYLHENGVSPFGLILWIPATLGGVLGYIRGGQWEEFSAVDTFPDPAYRPLADVDEDDKD